MTENSVMTETNEGRDALPPAIEMFVQQRLIPFPADVLAGAKLDDPRFLSPQPPPSIGRFTREQLSRDANGADSMQLPARTDGTAVEDRQ